MFAGFLGPEEEIKLDIVFLSSKRAIKRKKKKILLEDFSFFCSVQLISVIMILRGKVRN